MKPTGTRILYEIKTLVAPYPRVALPVARWRERRGHGEAFVRGTEIVIEGFPRTGSNFAVAAFRPAQGRPVRIAHHTHAPANLIAAAQHRVPALVLIRDPEEAVLSCVIWHRHMSVRQALRGYVRFYQPLVPHRRRLAVASFEEVTSDMGAVITQVNARFGTSFAEFDHTEENVRACFEEIDRHYRGQFGSDQFEQVVARPSAERSRIKDELRAAFRERTPERLRARARALHDALTREPKKVNPGHDEGR